MKAGKAKPKQPALRVRNKGLRKVRVGDLVDAEFNFRTHPESQAAALDGAIDELGFHGYPLCYELPDGRIGLYDGHLRKARLLERFGPDTEIEVAITDFDEAEAKKAMLSTDPLAAMAEADAQKLDELLREVNTGNEALAEMLEKLAEDNGIVEVAEGEWPAHEETSEYSFIVTYTSEQVDLIRRFVGVDKLPINGIGKLVLERIKAIAQT